MENKVSAKNVSKAMLSEKQKLEMFPWISTVWKRFFKCFPADYDPETLRHFHLCISEEIQEVFSSSNEKKAKALFSTLSEFYNHFCWKTKWDKDYFPMKASCVITLSDLTKVCLFLSGGNPDSNWLSRAISTMMLFPGGNNLMYEALLLLNSLKKKYKDAFAVVLNHMLCSNPIITSDCAIYFKLILLFRRLKILLKDKFAKVHILSIAARIQPPVDVEHFLQSNGLGNLPVISPKMLAQQFMGKQFPPEVFFRLRQVVLTVKGFESDSAVNEIDPAVEDFVIDTCSSNDLLTLPLHEANVVKPQSISSKCLPNKKGTTIKKTKSNSNTVTKKKDIKNKPNSAYKLNEAATTENNEPNMPIGADSNIEVICIDSPNDEDLITSKKPNRLKRKNDQEIFQRESEPEVVHVENNMLFEKDFLCNNDELFQSNASHTNVLDRIQGNENDDHPVFYIDSRPSNFEEPIIKKTKKRKSNVVDSTQLKEFGPSEFLRNTNVKPHESSPCKSTEKGHSDNQLSCNIESNQQHDNFGNGNDVENDPHLCINSTPYSVSEKLLRKRKSNVLESPELKEHLLSMSTLVDVSTNTISETQKSIVRSTLKRKRNSSRISIRIPNSPKSNLQITVNVNSKKNLIDKDSSQCSTNSENLCQQSFRNEKQIDTNSFNTSDKPVCFVSEPQQDANNEQAKNIELPVNSEDEHETVDLSNLNEANISSNGLEISWKKQENCSRSDASESQITKENIELEDEIIVGNSESSNASEQTECLKKSVCDKNDSWSLNVSGDSNEDNAENTEQHDSCSKSTQNNFNLLEINESCISKNIAPKSISKSSLEIKVTQQNDSANNESTQIDSVYSNVSKVVESYNTTHNIEDFSLTETSQQRKDTKTVCSENVQDFSTNNDDESSQVLDDNINDKNLSLNDNLVKESLVVDSKLSAIDNMQNYCNMKKSLFNYKAVGNASNLEKQKINDPATIEFVDKQNKDDFKGKKYPNEKNLNINKHNDSIGNEINSFQEEFINKESSFDDNVEESSIVNLTDCCNTVSTNILSETPSKNSVPFDLELSAGSAILTVPETIKVSDSIAETVIGNMQTIGSSKKNSQVEDSFPHTISQQDLNNTMVPETIEVSNSVAETVTVNTQAVGNSKQEYLHSHSHGISKQNLNKDTSSVPDTVEEPESDQITVRSDGNSLEMCIDTESSTHTIPKTVDVDENQKDNIPGNELEKMVSYNEQVPCSLLNDIVGKINEANNSITESKDQLLNHSNTIDVDLNATDNTPSMLMQVDFTQNMKKLDHIPKIDDTYSSQHMVDRNYSGAIPHNIDVANVKCASTDTKVVQDNATALESHVACSNDLIQQCQVMVVKLPDCLILKSKNMESVHKFKSDNSCEENSMEVNLADFELDNNLIEKTPDCSGSVHTTDDVLEDSLSANLSGSKNKIQESNVIDQDADGEDDMVSEVNNVSKCINSSSNEKANAGVLTRSMRKITNETKCFALDFEKSAKFLSFCEVSQDKIEHLNTDQQILASAASADLISFMDRRNLMHDNVSEMSALSEATTADRSDDSNSDSSSEHSCSELDNTNQVSSQGSLNGNCNIVQENEIHSDVAVDGELISEDSVVNDIELNASEESFVNCDETENKLVSNARERSVDDDDDFESEPKDSEDTVDDRKYDSSPSLLSPDKPNSDSIVRRSTRQTQRGILNTDNKKSSSKTEGFNDENIIPGSQKSTEEDEISKSPKVPLKLKLRKYASESQSKIISKTQISKLTSTHNSITSKVEDEYVSPKRTRRNLQSNAVSTVKARKRISSKNPPIECENSHEERQCIIRRSTRRLRSDSSSLLPFDIATLSLNSKKHKDSHLQAESKSSKKKIIFVDSEKSDENPEASSIPMRSTRSKLKFVQEPSESSENYNLRSRSIIQPGKLKL